MTEIYGIMAQLRAQAQQGEGSDKQILNTMTTRDKDKPLQCLHLHNNSMKGGYLVEPPFYWSEMQYLRKFSNLTCEGLKRGDCY